jgi:hypothetical protein
MADNAPSLMFLNVLVPFANFASFAVKIQRLNAEY